MQILPIGIPLGQVSIENQTHTHEIEIKYDHLKTNYIQMKYLFLGTLVLFASCNYDDEVAINCAPTLISDIHYFNFRSDTFEFVEIKSATSECIKISLSYSGGCDEVSAILADSGDILESDPPQRNLRLIFTDNDDCEALKKQDFYFNIENLKIEGECRVLLNFQGTEKTVLYKY